MSEVPLPFTCLHHVYTDSAGEDDYGNDKPGWLPPVVLACFWWSPTSTESTGAPTGGTAPSVDTVLVIDSAVSVDHRDKFTVDGVVFEVIGLPRDFNHGPYGYRPNRHVIELKWMGNANQVQ